MQTRSDQDFLNSARAFDTQSLAEIYDCYSPGLYAYAMRLLGDACLAEDCVSETFSRFLKALHARQGPETHLQAYLYRIAHNWITDHYRRVPVFDLNEDLRAWDEAGPEAQVDRRMRRERVRDALRMLTSDQRQVVVLRFLEGWNNEEVAAAVQKPSSAVRALQHRALASLRRWLLGKEKEDGVEYEPGH
jgi:RNA polymerase sigma-70 factor (ECF subfamily)